MNDDQKETGQFDVSRFDCFRGFQRLVLVCLLFFIIKAADS